MSPMPWSCHGHGASGSGQLPVASGQGQWPVVHGPWPVARGPWPMACPLIRVCSLIRSNTVCVVNNLVKLSIIVTV